MAVAALGGGCTAPESLPTRAQGPAAAEPVAAGREFERDWGERSLARVPAKVTLPDVRAWHAHASGSFTVLEHAPTRSTLTLRVTRAARLVRPEQCEDDARLARRSLPALDPNDIVERRRLAVPRGFDVRLTVLVEPRATGAVHGVAFAVGAATGRCYVAIYETEAAGAAAAEVVGDRLGLVVSGVLETLRVPEADERVAPPVGVE
ncbi:MAG TPA: hypothetical protein VGQ57_10915 [Polyangiaceae bacterium]|nr:hypothetical protein [Polyangiaceae bacterium]